MHWIDEAEQHKNKRENTRDIIHGRIDQKKAEINKNWDLNKDDYLAVISKLHNYIERINNLPPETRMDFGHIEAKEKPSSLHNHLIKYTSSKRFTIRRFDGLFSPYKAKHYKNTRNVFLCLSREINYVFIETKEIIAPRIRINQEPESTFKSMFSFLRRKEKIFVTRAKNIIKISDLNDEFTLYFIDFLAFKNDGKKYFFVDSVSRQIEHP